MDKETWLKNHRLTPAQLEAAQRALKDIQQGLPVFNAIRKYPVEGGGYVSKHALVEIYRRMVETGELDMDESLLARIRMKPMRTLSGVTTVTVLTAPGPCPGNCIFCPDDVRMPKSYLPDEPGAARAYQNHFDPYLQVSTRLESYHAVGHPSDKIELLILGGTWSSYDPAYQETFIRRCFDALNGRDASSLEEAQCWNETAEHRNVGLVIETRPDQITPQELAHLRRLGVTKVQMGAQSLDDEVLKRNCRGHNAAVTRRACALLRMAGFKIVLHWMPNLLGATPESDRVDFARLWLDCCPDELKIYPTQLLKSAPLYHLWERGEYTPYTTQELVTLIADIKPTIPPYCRVNRIIRDIPSDYVVEGNRRTSLRMDILAELSRRGQACRCIRCREVRGQQVTPEELALEDFIYHPAHAEEHFLSFVTADDKIAGYLRLSLPQSSPDLPPLEMADLEGAALIREVHVFGQSLSIGGEQQGAAQHAGLGKQLLKKAEEIASAAGFRRIAVISAIGTRRYYATRGFEMGELYMVKNLAAPSA